MAILYVEDNPDLRQITVRLLHRRGIEVVDVESGEQALKALNSSSHFTGVLLDIDLPGINGVETYRRLRKALPNLPAVVMSASLREDHRQSLLELGVPPECLLAKPCRFAELERALQNLV